MHSRIAPAISGVFLASFFLKLGANSRVTYSLVGSSSQRMAS